MNILGEKTIFWVVVVNSKKISAAFENFCDRIRDPPDFEPDWRRCGPERYLHAVI